MSFDGMLKVARLEFAIMVRNPVVLVMLLVLVLWAGVNAADAYVRLYSSENVMGYFTLGSLFAYEYNNFPFFVATNITFLALCVGVLSIMGDRSGGLLRVLITKPLYRRDVIVGKIIGMDAFIFLIIAVVSMLFVSFQFIAIGFSGDFVDLLLRTALNVVLMSVYSSLVVGIVLLFSMVFKNSLVALIASVSFAYSEWYLSFSFSELLGVKELMWIIPDELYGYIVHFNGQGLQSVSQPLDVWFAGCWPYIILLLAETLIVVLSVIMLFNREEA